MHILLLFQTEISQELMQIFANGEGFSVFHRIQCDTLKKSGDKNLITSPLYNYMALHKKNRSSKLLFLVAAGKDQVLVFTQEVLILPWASGQVVISNLIDHYCMCSNNEFLLH